MRQEFTPPQVKVPILNEVFTIYSSIKQAIVADWNNTMQSFLGFNCVSKYLRRANVEHSLRQYRDCFGVIVIQFPTKGTTSFQSCSIVAYPPPSSSSYIALVITSAHGIRYDFDDIIESPERKIYFIRETSFNTLCLDAIEESEENCVYKCDILYGDESKRSYSVHIDPITNLECEITGDVCLLGVKAQETLQFVAKPFWRWENPSAKFAIPKIKNFTLNDEVVLFGIPNQANCFEHEHAATMAYKISEKFTPWLPQQNCKDGRNTILQLLCQARFGTRDLEDPNIDKKVVTKDFIDLMSMQLPGDWNKCLLISRGNILGFKKHNLIRVSCTTTTGFSGAMLGTLGNALPFIHGIFKGGVPLTRHRHVFLDYALAFRFDSKQRAQELLEKVRKVEEYYVPVQNEYSPKIQSFLDPRLVAELKDLFEMKVYGSASDLEFDQVNANVCISVDDPAFIEAYKMVLKYHDWANMTADETEQIKEYCALVGIDPIE